MKQHPFQGVDGARCEYDDGESVCGELEHASPIHRFPPMTEEHETHLRSLSLDFLAAVDTKYRAGAMQHGGKLWTKPRLIEKAMEECVDQWVFLHALKMQRDNPSLIDPEAKDIDE